MVRCRVTVFRVLEEVRRIITAKQVLKLIRIHVVAVLLLVAGVKLIKDRINRC